MRVLQCVVSTLLVLLLPSIAGSQPTDLKYEIEGYKVKLKWHFHPSEHNPVERFYITIQEQKGGSKMGPPDYIQVPSSERRVSIVGLQQYRTYNLTVSAYLEDGGQESSETINVKAESLDDFKVQTVNISAITATSALFHWEYDAKHIILNYRLGVFCSGIQEHTTLSQKLLQTPHSIEHTFQITPQGWGSHMLGNLPPNAKLECEFTTFVWWGNRRTNPTKLPAFTTSYAAPPPPPTPLISKSHDKSEHGMTFTIKLFSTNDHFGPISYYKVFAVPVEKSETLENDEESSDAVVPYIPTVDVNSLVSTAVSSDLATEGMAAVPFLIGTYTTLPDHLAIDGHRTGHAFKPLTHYAAVVAAFTKAQDGNTEMYSYSAPSDPPVYIGEGVTFEGSKKSAQDIMTTLSSKSSSSCKAYCTMCLLLVK